MVANYKMMDNTKNEKYPQSFTGKEYEIPDRVIFFEYVWHGTVDGALTFFLIVSPYQKIIRYCKCYFDI